MGGKDITEFYDRNDKLVRLRIKKCQASNKRIYFRLTGTVNKEHIDRQHKSKALAFNSVYNFKDTFRTLERCLGQTEVKSIKLSVMAIACHKRLPRRRYSERHKHTLSDSDLRSIYCELGYEEYCGNTMIKYLTNPPT